MIEEIIKLLSELHNFSFNENASNKFKKIIILANGSVEDRKLSVSILDKIIHNKKITNILLKNFVAKTYNDLLLKEKSLNNFIDKKFYINNKVYLGIFLYKIINNMLGTYMTIYGVIQILKRNSNSENKRLLRTIETLLIHLNKFNKENE